jgi:putative transposase
MCEFIKNETIDFSTAIALQDVPFSNSLVETQNKLFKYHYLYRQEYENGDDLKRDLQRTFMTIILFARIFP